MARPQHPASETPRPVLPLEYARDGDELRGAQGWVDRHAVLLAWLCSLVGVILIAVEVETVLVTGFVITGAGVYVIVRGVKRRNAWRVVIGAGHVGVCLFMFVLEQVMQWGPSGAQTPFLFMGVIYVIVGGVLAAAVGGNRIVR